ncbi:MAG: c-type cytochrome domain-containing protein, partial [Planctomycetota bacterium]
MSALILHHPFSLFLRVVSAAVITAAIALSPSDSRASADSRASEPPHFGEQVWPILQTRCVECHNDSVREGGLSLLTRADLTRGGSRGPSIDKVSPDASPLIELIRLDAHPRMPFEEEPLSVEQIDILTRWVRGGATYGEVSEAAVDRLQRKQQLAGFADTVHSIAFAPVKS